jgi:two-component system LytT family response regulator
LVEIETIEWIDAAGDYMCVHAANETYILRSTMKELEKKLTAEFVRIHRSTIVNLRKVRSVDAIPKGECLLHLDDDVSLKVSRNYRSAVQDLMG